MISIRRANSFRLLSSNTLEVDLCTENFESVPVILRASTNAGSNGYPTLESLIRAAIRLEDRICSDFTLSQNKDGSSEISFEYTDPVEDYFHEKIITDQEGTRLTVNGEPDNDLYFLIA